ncbi:HofP DNA utilization family protein [Vagococcus sp. WN89Y]|uniref:HofP DNA utilization family protein n=1 Tax=Vagococcus sp. WN89Y TaxID=3457258 RepID=UPI003FCE4601
MIKRLLLAATLCLLLSGMRNPFQPAAQPCQGMLPERWQYHGAVTGGQALGFLRDAEGRWHRVTAGRQLNNGWQVEAMTMHEMVLTRGEECLPAQWRLKREGTRNEKMDSGAGIQQPVGSVGAGGAARHADAG